MDYSNNTQMDDGDGLTFTGATRDSFTTDNTGVVCFTKGTAIRTPRGDVQVDRLRVGDLVSTLDNGLQRIRWIGTTTLGVEALAARPKQRPVLIQRGVLGVARDLLVSPQHGMMIGTDHLARATHLAKTTRGIRVAHGKKQVTYVHIMFDAHQIVFAEGVPSESFYPGPMALKMMSVSAREGVFAIWPNLRTASDRDAVARIYGSTARPFLLNREVAAAMSTDEAASRLLRARSIAPNVQAISA